MRVLVRASTSGFSYAETFWEPDPDAIPQLVLLEQLNISICARLAGASPLPDCEAILVQSQFLRDRHVRVNLTVFEHGFCHLIEQIRQGCYDLSGSRVYRYPP